MSELKSKITKHSDLEAILRETGCGDIPLIEPPRNYLATLIDSSSGTVVGRKFNEYESDDILKGLVGDALGLSLEYCELHASTLQHWLDEKLEYESSCYMKGSDIRYSTLRPNTTKKKKGLCNYIDLNDWVTCSDSITIHFNRAIPFMGEDVPANLHLNITKTLAALRDKLATVQEALDRHNASFDLITQYILTLKCQK